MISVLFLITFIMQDGSSNMNNRMKDIMGYNSLSDIPKKSQGIEKLSFIEKDGVKEFRLNAEPVQWEYSKGKYVLAWGYNGQVPGPEIRVTEGDNVRIIFTNNLPKPTTIHWHGLEIPNSQDGIPGITQEPIQPGESFTYEFTAKPSGTRFYHTHGSGRGDEAEQLDMGLSGAFIIEPKNKLQYDREYTLILDEWNTMNHMSGEDMGHMEYNLFTINGKAFPDTEQLKVKQGERVLVRFINAGTSTTHPMHLHGQSFKIVATDGNPVPAGLELTKDTLNIAPGERYDIEINTTNPGAWIIHCHELHHADMGMVIPFVYEGFEIKTENTVQMPTISHSGGHQ